MMKKVMEELQIPCRIEGGGGNYKGIRKKLFP